MVILNLGSLAGCQAWPLPRLQAVQKAKMYAFMVTSQFAATRATTWVLMIGSIEWAHHQWESVAPYPSPVIRQHLLFILLLVISCGRATWNIWPMRSCTSPSRRAASTPPPSQLKPKLCWPNKPPTD
jgi:hypothetical protein